MKNLKGMRIVFITIALLCLSFMMNVTTVEASTENVAFDSTFYANMNDDVRNSFGYDTNALRNHWLNYGIAEGRRASLVLNLPYYLKNNGDLSAVFGNNYKLAYEHFINYGIKEARKTSLVFDVAYYLNNNGDLKAAYGNNYQLAYEHFINYGIKEGRKASPIFDVKYYLNSNGDLKAAYGSNYKAAYEHFINYGIKEGRKTSTTFDVKYYLNNNGDIKAAYGSDYEAAYTHYLAYGIKEKRKCAATETVTTTTLSASQIAKNPSKYYGQTVNYTPKNKDTSVAWKIFYADNDNIYLITDNYILSKNTPAKNGKSAAAPEASSKYYAFISNPKEEYATASNISDTIKNKWLSWAKSYSIEYSNAKATAYLLDTTIWNASYGNQYTEYVIGSPTLELYAASWNAKGYAKLSWGIQDKNGYQISVEGVEANNNDYYRVEETTGYSDKLYYPNEKSDEKAFGYWLASPFSASYVNYASSSDALPVIYSNPYGQIGPYWLELSGNAQCPPYGLRPVVCLKSGTKLVDNGKGSYQIQ